MSTISGVTPTYTLTLPDDIDLSQASYVYVSFADKSGVEYFRKTGSDLTIDANVVQVFLSQTETLQFDGMVLIQINWTYPDGSRACTTMARDYYGSNLVSEVL